MKWIEFEDSRYRLVHVDDDLLLYVQGNTDRFALGKQWAEDGCLFPLIPENSEELRRRLPWLNPQPLGLRASVGMGDRLGLATPGHIRAVRNTGMAPIFAQQSVRENTRTGRTPLQVLDDAVWGIFQEDWRDPWGADADHLKQPEDLGAFIRAGYTFFTIDPGEKVATLGQDDSIAGLNGRIGESAWKELSGRYLGQVYDLEGFPVVFDELALLRAAAKYGAAVEHAALMYRAVEAGMGGKPFDFEVSVDETDSPTSALEHFWIASELQRAGVHWVSLAPRFVGAFEKGVDYIGDLAELDQSLAQHAAVARRFGDYKLSLHSGSDKFSVYPLAARRTRGRVHLKTAGTSYLEALRVLSRVEVDLFREIYRFSRERYEIDRASYHVSARLERAPDPEKLADWDLPALLEQFDARQVLHVTFGTVLDRFGARLKEALTRHAEAYADGLQAHFVRHLEPFSINQGTV